MQLMIGPLGKIFISILQSRHTSTHLRLCITHPSSPEMNYYFTQNYSTGKLLVSGGTQSLRINECKECSPKSQ